MNKELENNNVTMAGKIVKNFEFSHEVYGEGFYTAMLAIQRASEMEDIIPIMVSERLVDVNEEWEGRFVRVNGQFRSYNKYEDKRNHLVLSVFVRELFEIDPECEDMCKIYGENHIFIDGYICKQPICRKTPLGREISDILIAANRPYGKSDYIPCIAWGRNARFAESLGVGTRIKVDGRIQSREYQKRISDDEYETRTAYEVSASKLAVVEETEE